MLQSRRELRSNQPPDSAKDDRDRRSGFTLVELVISMSILAFTAAVFSGLMFAISSAWDHSTNLEDGRRQAQTTLSRINWMVQQSGTYRVSGQSTMLGLAVLPTNASFYMAPTTFVVWSGGSNGGMNAQGLQTRLPVASELVVYAPDATKPAQFTEITFPGNSTAVDFSAATFATTIQTLLQSSGRQTVVLSDRLHVSSLGSSSAGIGTSRFELRTSPSDTEIAAVTAGSQAWNALSWGQGMVSSDRGLRTTNVRIELLLDPDPKKPTSVSNGYSTAIPFLGSVNRQYVYQK